jgi:excisionase family DNA binding protein
MTGGTFTRKDSPMLPGYVVLELGQFKLYTVPEVAAILRVKPATVYTWIRNHKLDAIRAGRLIRVRGDQLSAFMKCNVENCIQETVTHVEGASI